jgi:uncharacterized protein YecT (DUF1311 family)
MSLMMSLTLVAASAQLCSMDGPQQEMNQCAYQRFAAADKDLNAIWPKAVASAKASDKQRDPQYDSRPDDFVTLRSAQRAWITFRDAHCTMEGYDARGGSMEPMLFNLCRETLTRARISQLESMLEGLE